MMDSKNWYGHRYALALESQSYIQSNGRPQTATLAEYQSSIVIKIRY
jgi:hypothetical protein